MLHGIAFKFSSCGLTTTDQVLRLWAVMGETFDPQTIFTGTYSMGHLFALFWSMEEGIRRGGKDLFVPCVVKTTTF